MTVATRGDIFWSRVQKTDGCWLWTGTLTSNGYGKYSGTVAHRAAYEKVIGPIPDGLELDHTCCNIRCVNPQHLEPVTRAENARRRGARQTHCRNGHEYGPENAYVYKGRRNYCRRCNAAAVAAYKLRKRGKP